MNFLLLLEWFAAFCALGGAILASGKWLSPNLPWKLWISANILFICLFFFTEQNGLLTLHLFGLFINSLGLYQHQHPEEGQVSNKSLMKVFFYFSLILIALSLSNGIHYIFTQKVSSLEWTGTFAGIAGALLLASKHKFSNMCWYVWSFSNLSVFILALFYTHQYGLLLLQGGFMVTNIIGIYSYNFNKKEAPIDTLEAISTNS